MSQEIERKFLVKDDSWRSGAGRGTLYRQGYLSVDPSRVVRVRIAGAKGYLTIKGRTAGITRDEFEYTIPTVDALVMLDRLCIRPLIEKTRYRIDHEGHTWEVDEFVGDNAGLIIAEVELSGSDVSPGLPAWVGREVSDDPRYFNSNLAQHSFREWRDDRLPAR